MLWDQRLAAVRGIVLSGTSFLALYAVFDLSKADAEWWLAQRVLGGLQLTSLCVLQDV